MAANTVGPPMREIATMKLPQLQELAAIHLGDADIDADSTEQLREKLVMRLAALKAQRIFRVTAMMYNEYGTRLFCLPNGEPAHWSMVGTVRQRFAVSFCTKT